MAHELTHASFFSGVGGLDLGLERAGWRTVSFSEIDPYANAVLAERWPGVPNLGDITALSQRLSGGHGRSPRGIVVGASEVGNGTNRSDAVPNATLWSGGFPCQDLSVAGKRAGFAGARSGLAFAFLDLVERHRPPAILLENVPGLLSSHKGRDFGALLDRLAQLGYGWAYRILDARHFGVPQRRRRVFIVALNAERGFGPDSAAAVLSVGARCERHPATGHQTGEGVAEPARPGVDARAVTGTSGKRHDTDTDTLIGTLREHVRPGSNTDYSILSPPPDPGGVRAPDGLAGRVDDQPGVAHALRAKGNDAHAADLQDYIVDPVAATLNSGGNDGGFRTEPGEHLVVAPTLRVGSQRPQDGGPGDTVPIVVGALNGTKERGGWRAGPDEAAAGHIRSTHIALGQGPQDDPLLPLGLDSHRYRCCGNGVVSSVAEWIGLRLREVVTVPAATPGASPK